MIHSSFHNSASAVSQLPEHPVEDSADFLSQGKRGGQLFLCTEADFPANSQLRIQLEAGASCNAQKVKIFAPGGPSVALGNIGGDGDGGPAQLGAQAVLLLRRKATGKEIDDLHQLDAFLPYDQLLVSTHSAQFPPSIENFSPYYSMKKRKINKKSVVRSSLDCSEKVLINILQMAI